MTKATEYAPQLYVSNYDTIMLVGTRWPYYWLQHRLEPDDVIQKLIVSTTPMPFTKGLSIVSLPEGVTITLDYNLHIPEQPLPDKSSTKSNPRADFIRALDRRIMERAIKIAAKIPVGPEPATPRVDAILERIRLRELKTAAKHPKVHFLKVPPVSVDTPYPWPTLVDEEPIETHYHPINYKRMSALQEIAGGTNYPAVDSFACLEPIPEILETDPEPPLPCIELAPELPTMIIMQVMSHPTTTRGMGHVR